MSVLKEEMALQLHVTSASWSLASNTLAACSRPLGSRLVASNSLL